MKGNTLIEKREGKIKVNMKELENRRRVDDVGRGWGGGGR